MNAKLMTVKQYDTSDMDNLFKLLEHEGEEWAEYWSYSCRDKFVKALANSICYVLYKEQELCGYLRCRDDNGYGVYIMDLLVSKEYRGKEYGRTLIEQLCKDYASEAIYILSDADPYYEKLGYKQAGSIFMCRKIGRSC